VNVNGIEISQKKESRLIDNFADLLKNGKEILDGFESLFVKIYY